MIEGQVEEERFAWQGLIVWRHGSQSHFVGWRYGSKLIHALREGLKVGTGCREDESPHTHMHAHM